MQEKSLTERTITVVEKGVAEGYLISHSKKGVFKL